MKELIAAHTDSIAVILSEHHIFGWKYQIHTARTLPDTDGECIQLCGIPDVGQEELRGASPDVLRLIATVDSISDRELMNAYSKSKSVVALRDEMTKEKLEHYVRPRIELANRKITELIRQTGIPLFFRKDRSSTRFYTHDRIHLLPTDSSCVFHFKKDCDGLQYFISLTHAARAVSLNVRPAVVISDSPAIVLLGKDIHCITQIDAKKLTPFFTRACVRIPPLSEEIYLKSFVFKIMQQYEVQIEGLPVRRTHPPKKAFLSLEKDLRQELALILSFRYGEDERFYPDLRRMKTFKLEQDGDTPVICCYARDLEWETALADKLRHEGLICRGTHHFYPADDAPYHLIEWLNRKYDTLKDLFTLEQQPEQNYFTGRAVLEASCDERPDWFDIRITVTLGTHRLPFIRFRKHILEKIKEFRLPDGTTFILPDEWFAKYAELFLYAREEASGLRLKKMHAPSLELAMPEHTPDSATATPRFHTLMQPPAAHPEPPAHLDAILRPYQRQGFYWLAHLCRHGFGGCLADDMGLGKTLQAITLLQHLYDDPETPVSAGLRPPGGQLSLFDPPHAPLPASLVVAPVSLLHNWSRELKRFAPHLRTLIYAGNNRRHNDPQRTFSRYQIVVTSYGTLRNDIAHLRSYPFRMLILDESQYIKNPESQSFRAVMQLTAAHRLALTGTPVENSLEDLWAQFNCINEGLLGTFASFRKHFLLPIVKDRDERQQERLKKIIAPFLLRRTKEEVTPELPPLQQEIVCCDMSEAQEAVYNDEKNRIRNLLLEMMDAPGPKNSFIALEGLNRLRQIANHPKLIFPDYAGDAGKFDQVVRAFENLRASGHKVLIFSSYVKHLQLFADRFDAQGWSYSTLTGRMTAREREQSIHTFTTQAQTHCLLISLKAGGVGLNLTAADYVFLLDPWWNPAAEMQALSRAHRIGQDKPVIACRFISTDTVEEKILRLQDTKIALAETFINNNDPFASLNWTEIRDLLA
ncbi:MAG: DEAD/DEAH box helicase [Tannerella sp.]|jgi:SNF2 family DNA or RNA helicase|nr:DEAD/DEAH box helicase [Tannerella sp.]